MLDTPSVEEQVTVTFLVPRSLKRQVWRVFPQHGDLSRFLRHTLSKRVQELEAQESKRKAKDED